jgi:RNA polymerase sigma-70 factor (ECF subfamily)
MAALDDHLAAWEAEAAARWPKVAVARDALARWIAARTDGADPAALHGAELLLACACAAGDTAALAAFDAELLTKIPRFVSRVDGSRAFADEATQAVRALLFVPGAQGAAPKIHEYSGRGPLEGWLRVVAVRLALRMKRRDDRHASDVSEVPDRPPSSGAGRDPELAFIKERHRPDFVAALESAITSLTPLERTILRQYFLDGLTVEQLGALHQVAPSTISRRLAAARASILAAVRRDLSKRLGLPAAELESLLGMVQSQLDVSLSGLLKRSAG